MIEEVYKGLTLGETQLIFLIFISYLFFEYLSRFIYYTVNSYYFEYVLRSKFQNLLTRKFSEKLASLDFTNLEDGEVRNLIAKVEDTYVWRLQDNLRLISYLIYNSAALILSFLIASKFNLIYFFLLVLFSVPFYYLRAKYGNVYWSIYSSQAKETNYLWYLRNIFTNFQTLSEIKIYQTADYFLGKMKQVQDQLLKNYSQPIKKYTFWSMMATGFLPIIIYFALRDFTFQIFLKKYTIGDFTFFLNTLFTFSGEISNILLNIGSLYENDLFVDDYFKLMYLKNKTIISLNPRKISEVKKIEFRNVSFIYPSSKNYALKNINLIIQKGENIAIVGHNGAGKTTLIKLLFRFYDPTEGKILVNNIDLRELDLNFWYDQFGVLFQDFAKYYLTLKENIFFGNVKKLDEQLVRKALIKADGEELLKFDKGLEQVLGRWFEEGKEISVGQWQKVAIARVLYRDAPFLVLDEPTSNIDPQGEEEIFKNLLTHYREKTLIFISHRFSTVRKAEKIYVL